MTAARMLAVCALVLTGACRPSGTANRSDAVPSRSDAVDALVVEVVDETEPGLAALVVDDGAIAHAAGYGLADIEEGAEIGPDTVLHLASCAKQMTALGVMLLAEDNELDYGDPIASHIRELAPLGTHLTIRHLLHHTGGVPDIAEELEASTDEPTNDAMLKLVAEIGLESEPGEREEYSNVGYEILGSLIERVSDMPYRLFMRERIFDPLGMADTFSVPDDERLEAGQRATGYAATAEGFDVDDSDPLDGLVGSGSIYTTARDMYAYDVALDEGTLLDHDRLADAFAGGELADGRPIDYGFGWALGDEDGHRFTAHEGGWSGYASYYLRYPDDGVTVVLLANRDDLDLEALAFEIGDVFLVMDD